MSPIEFIKSVSQKEKLDKLNIIHEQAIKHHF